MESGIPVVHGDLDVLQVLVGESVGLSTVDLRQHGVFTHGKSGEHGGNDGRSVSDIVVRSSVGSIVVSVKEDV